MNVRLRLVGVVIGLGAAFSLTGCEFLSQKQEEAAKASEAKKDAAIKESDKKDGPPVDVGFLLSMSYTEAKALSPASLEIPPFYKIAADEIKVLSEDEQKQPKRVRAKGHVYIQIEFRDEIIALGQEALIGDDEVILRGKPLMQRGLSVVEGLDDVTVFYIRGTKLHVLGKHRVTKAGDVTTGWKSNWREGPNPLLPALSPDDVPKEIRGSPLLPLPSKEAH